MERPGAWDEPLELNGEYLWWDATNDVFRYSATAPTSETDGTELGGGTGELPTGYYDDPFVVGAVYLWHDVTNDVLRVSKSAPTSTDERLARIRQGAEAVRAQFRPASQSG